MSYGKSGLKLPVNHIGFKLNLKIILLPLFDAQESIYKKNRTWNLIFWSHFFCPTQIRGVQANENYELSVPFFNSPICWKKT